MPSTIQPSKVSNHTRMYLKSHAGSYQGTALRRAETLREGGVLVHEVTILDSPDSSRNGKLPHGSYAQHGSDANRSPVIA